jgi:small subunit ribosomal protein S9
MADQLLQWHAVGRRKRAVARVYLRPGKGTIVVNKRTVDEYFSRAKLVQVLSEPLVLAERKDAYDILVTVDGGGLSGQAGAIRLGIARALDQAEPKLRPPLKHAGFFTRDAREVERKKYGRPGARKRFQFSKR